mgnify:CR=1 FL=1|jgi:[ribosomal protein S5]-alanine N-acetyltransferase
MSRIIAATKKIYFRPITKEDIEGGWLDWINDRELNKYLVHKKPTIKEDLEKYLEESRPPSAYMFAICLRKDNKYIGNVRLSSIDWVNRRASYGRLIGNKNLQGMGIGTEVLILLAYYAFYHLNLNRIQTGVVSKNIGSIKSNKKAGAVNEGLIRKSEYIDGEYYDSLMFGMTIDDFNSTKWEEVVDRNY